MQVLCLAHFLHSSDSAISRVNLQLLPLWSKSVEIVRDTFAALHAVCSCSCHAHHCISFGTIQTSGYSKRVSKWKTIESTRITHSSNSFCNFALLRGCQSQHGSGPQSEPWSPSFSLQCLIIMPLRCQPSKGPVCELL